MHNHPGSVRPRRMHLAALWLCLAFWLAAPPAGAEEAAVKGTLTHNGETVPLPYVYVWPEKSGFYKDSDPTWSLLFVERPLEVREIGELVSDAAWVHIGITKTDEFSGAPELQVYTQSIKFSGTSGGNISGGKYPEIEIQGLGTDGVSGRVWHAAPQTVFDDSFQYDFSFATSMSDPDAPIGDVLPVGGGEPGKAYLAWVETIHAGDVDRLKSIVPPEMAAQLDAVTAEEAREEIEFMRMMTPTDINIVGGSSDGDTALLQIEGLMDGGKVTAEITMTRMGEYWIPTSSSM